MSSDVFAHLSVLSEPTRARLLRTLEIEELGVGELARVVQLPQSTVSRHLKVLHGDGWVERRKEGTASLFRGAELPPDARAVWEAVRPGADARWADEDDLRIRAVVAARTVDSPTFFGRVAGEWDQVRQELFGTEFLLPTLLSLLPPDWTVLDLGTGTGSTLVELAPVVRRVIGVDREQVMLDAASRRCADLGAVELVHASLDDLPLDDGSVDAALCMLVLHHLQDVPPVLAEAARVLRPGGALVILDMVEHDRTEYRQAMGHHHLGFAEEALCSWLSEAGFGSVRFRRLPAHPEAKGPPLFVTVARLA